MLRMNRQLTVRYSVCEWACSSHCANLAVHVAICGKITQRPTENNAICAATTRLYKYLVGDYSEEFAMSFKNHVLNHLNVLPSDAPDGNQDRVHSLGPQRLYGSQALPDDLLVFFNRSLARFEH